MQTPSTTVSTPCQAHPNKIDSWIGSVNLNYPRNAVNHYGMEKMALEKTVNPTANLVGVTKKYISEWKGMAAEEKKKYVDMFETERDQYNKELELIRYLLYPKGVTPYGTSAQKLYTISKIQEALTQDKSADVDEIKKSAGLEWSGLNNLIKGDWDLKKQSNDLWWLTANSKKTTPYLIFTKKQINQYVEQGNTSNGIKLVADDWKQLSTADKALYERISHEVNTEKTMNKEGFDIINNVKPKIPKSALQLYTSQNAEILSKSDFRKRCENAKKYWEELPPEEKEDYIIHAKYGMISYKFKKILYKARLHNIKAIHTKNIYNVFIEKLSEEKGPPNCNFIDYARERWAKITEEEKGSGKLGTVDSRAERDDKVAALNSGKYVFNTPKEIPNCYSGYGKSKIPEVKRDFPDGDMIGVFKKCAKDWRELSDEEKMKVYEIAYVEKEEYHKKKAEFIENGYYIQDKIPVKMKGRQRQGMEIEQKRHKCAV